MKLFTLLFRNTLLSRIRVEARQVMLDRNRGQAVQRACPGDYRTKQWAEDANAHRDPEAEMAATAGAAVLLETVEAATHTPTSSAGPGHIAQRGQTGHAQPQGILADGG